MSYYSAGLSPDKPTSISDRPATQLLLNRTAVDLSRTSITANGMRRSIFRSEGGDARPVVLSPSRTDSHDRSGLLRSSLASPGQRTALGETARLDHSSLGRRTAVRISDHVQEHRYEDYPPPPRREDFDLSMAAAEGRVADTGRVSNTQFTQALTSNMKLHDDVTERDALIQQLNEGCAQLEERMKAMREERAQCDAVLDQLRTRIDELEKQAALQTEVHQQNKDAMQHELDLSQLEVRNRAGEADRLLKKLGECETYLRRAQKETEAAREDAARLSAEREHWAREAQRLSGELDEAKRHAFELSASCDAQIKKTRMELHEVQSRLTAAEVEKSVAVSEKTDMLEDINRLTRRLAERDAEVAKLNRLLEQRDQAIAEMAPLAKQSSRITKMQKGTWSPKDSGRWK
eukprot:m.86857 g.86857  ORF g.86857 m.86857 type:complete len:405 (+) comp8297_c0_seq1:62-1276(+)